MCSAAVASSSSPACLHALGRDSLILLLRMPPCAHRRPHASDRRLLLALVGSSSSLRARRRHHPRLGSSVQRRPRGYGQALPRGGLVDSSFRAACLTAASPRLPTASSSRSPAAAGSILGARRPPHVRRLSVLSVWRSFSREKKTGRECVVRGRIRSTTSVSRNKRHAYFKTNFDDIN